MPATILSLLSLSFDALAQTSYKSEFDRAQREYEAAAKQALEPVKHRYAETLQLLSKRATAANDLDTALKIKDALGQLGPASIDNRLVGTKWTFPVKGQPREQQWIEFRDGGVLQIGWDPAPKTWKLLSADRVEIHPYSSDKFSFVISLDASLRKGKILEGELKGQTIDRAK